MKGTLQKNVIFFYLNANMHWHDLYMTLETIEASNWTHWEQFQKNIFLPPAPGNRGSARLATSPKIMLRTLRNIVA